MVKRPAHPDLIKARILDYASRPEPQEVSRGLRGSVIGYLNDFLGGDENRYLVLGWFFAEDGEPLASKDLTPQQWKGLARWIGARQAEDGRWYPHEAFAEEAMYVLNLAKWEAEDED